MLRFSEDEEASRWPQVVYGDGSRAADNVIQQMTTHVQPIQPNESMLR